MISRQNKTLAVRSQNTSARYYAMARMHLANGEIDNAEYCAERAQEISARARRIMGIESEV